MHSLLNYIVYGIIKIISWLPLFILYKLSDILYILIYYVFTYRKKISYQNLQNAFPEKSIAEIKHIHQQFYHHFCDLLVEGIHFISVGKKEITKRCIFKNPELLTQYYAQNKSICLAMGHYANWEWATSYALHYDVTLLPIYKPLRNKFFDNVMRKTRSRFGAIPIKKNNVFREMIKYKNRQTVTATIFITDQTPKGKDIHHWIPFLNQQTPVFLGIEKIAIKFNQAVFFANMRKIKRGYYEIEFIEICKKPTTSKELEITQSHTQLLEKLIRKEPAYWLWTHKRWKYKKTTP